MVNKDEILKKAKDFHNSQPDKQKVMLCISSIYTQVITLKQMKIKIMNNTKAECNKIDSWINNCIKDLDRLLNEFDKENPNELAE